ncbi:hypothetical protein RU90_GL000900 [Lactococcus lactis subsp. hordniae]|uniref:Uncharacterized protein n=1 Tax=Lactococcus lactis subsp. hordniae TaxID=203404 RepID=A0A2A5SKN1_LACLH|nr:hypothetical protein RU90_GL000900 [Lactococcus lactis subsp. hordniae]
MLFISLLTQMNTAIPHFNTFLLFLPYIFVRSLDFIFSVLIILPKIPLAYNVSL